MCVCVRRREVVDLLVVGLRLRHRVRECVRASRWAFTGGALLDARPSWSSPAWELHGSVSSPFASPVPATAYASLNLAATSTRGGGQRHNVGGHGLNPKRVSRARTLPTCLPTYKTDTVLYLHPIHVCLYISPICGNIQPTCARSHITIQYKTGIIHLFTDRPSRRPAF